MKSYSFWPRSNVFQRRKHMLSVSSRHDTYTDAVLVETWFLGQWCSICQGGLACLELLFNCLFCWIYMQALQQCALGRCTGWGSLFAWVKHSLTVSRLDKEEPIKGFSGNNSCPLQAMELKAKERWQHDVILLYCDKKRNWWKIVWLCSAIINSLQVRKHWGGHYCTPILGLAAN